MIRENIKKGLKLIACSTLIVLMLAGNALAANRYWVVGGVDTNFNTTGNWSTSSGGSGGASVPGASDNCFADSNSGSGNITVNVTSQCLDFDGTGFTGTLTNSSSSLFVVNGNLTLGSGMSVTISTTNDFQMRGTGTHTVTTNGASIGASGLYFRGTGTFTLQDNFTTTGTLKADRGTLDLNDNDVTAADLNFVSAIAGQTINMGNGTITVNKTGAITVVSITDSGGNLTYNTEGSTIVVDVVDANIKQLFLGTGQTHNAVTVSGVGSGEVRFLEAGARTINTLTFDAPRTYTFANSNTLTIGTAWVVNSSSGNVATIVSDAAGTAATISSANQISLDWMSIKDSTAANNTPFYAGDNSTDVSGNTNWTFTAPPAVSAIPNKMIMY